MSAAMDLSPLGVWVRTDAMTARETAAFARRVESLGYSALWFPEILGRHAFVQAGWLLAATERLIVATGIANLYLREPFAAASARNTLAEQSEGRFILGLGISHSTMVEGILGKSSKGPVAAVASYLDSMEKALYQSPPPAKEPPTVLAALAPKLLALAAERTRGAHTYLVPPEHTAMAREILGPDAWLCVEQKVLLEPDRSAALPIARQAAAFYVGLANYQKSLRRLGFDDADFADGGSDRLMDALVAHGDERAIAARIAEHRQAGATHVCLQPIDPTGSGQPDLRVLEALAPGKAESR
jgi:probable F420-dependent oxidoreductase